VTLSNTFTKMDLSIGRSRRERMRRSSGCSSGRDTTRLLCTASPTGCAVAVHIAAQQRHRYVAVKAADDTPLVARRRSARVTTTNEKRYGDETHDPKSPNFHHWLNANEVGAQFGPAPSDIQTAIAWLRQHGFTVSTAGLANNDDLATIGLKCPKFKLAVNSSRESRYWRAIGGTLSRRRVPTG
jgi:Pro-kumamolisin, activation domain